MAVHVKPELQGSDLIGVSVRRHQADGKVIRNDEPIIIVGNWQEIHLPKGEAVVVSQLAQAMVTMCGIETEPFVQEEVFIWARAAGEERQVLVGQWIAGRGYAARRNPPPVPIDLLEDLVHGAWHKIVEAA